MVDCKLRRLMLDAPCGLLSPSTGVWCREKALWSGTKEIGYMLLVTAPLSSGSRVGGCFVWILLPQRLPWCSFCHNVNGDSSWRSRSGSAFLGAKDTITMVMRPSGARLTDKHCSGDDNVPSAKEGYFPVSGRVALDRPSGEPELLWTAGGYGYGSGDRAECVWSGNALARTDRRAASDRLEGMGCGLHTQKHAACATASLFVRGGGYGNRSPE